MTKQTKHRFIPAKFGHGLGRPELRSLPISHPSAIFFSGIGSGGVSIVSGSRVRVRENRFFHFTEFQLPPGQARVYFLRNLRAFRVSAYRRFMPSDIRRLASALIVRRFRVVAAADVSGLT